MPTDQVSTEEQMAAATVDTPADEAAAPPQAKRLGILRGISAVLILFGMQVVAGIGAVIVLGKDGFFEQQPLVAAISIVAGGLVLYAWVRGGVRRFGQGFADQIGLKPSSMPAADVAKLIAVLFVVMFIVQLAYGTLVLTGEAGEAAKGEAEKIFAQALANGDTLGLGAMLFAACFIAPIFEEVAFRGYLQSALKNVMPTWGAIAIASVAFSAVHGNLLLSPIYFMIGAALGYVFNRTGSLKPAIAFHMVNNVIFSALTLMGFE